MAQLAEAYVHLRPYDFNDRQARELGRYLDGVAARVAQEIFDRRVVVDVELEEGSLRTWVTVSGILLTAYGGIANYKGFKESISEIVNDARAFSEAIYEPFIKKTDASKDQVYRFERRLKTPGRLYRLARRLEKLEQSVNQLSSNDLKRELYRARKELERIEADLTPSERSRIETLVKTPSLPPVRRWPTEPEVTLPKVAHKEEHEQPSLFDPQVGFMVPALQIEPREPRQRVVYRHRTIVEPKRRGRDTRLPERTP